MGKRNEVVEGDYRVEEGSKVEVVPVLFFGAVFVSAAFVAAVHYYWGMEAARWVLIAVGALWVITGVIAGINYMNYRFMDKAGRLINDHQRVDDAGETERIDAMLGGITGLLQGTAQNDRNAVNAQAVGLKWATLVTREANRLAEERVQNQPAANDDFILQQLFGADEPLLIEGDD